MRRKKFSDGKISTTLSLLALAPLFSPSIFFFFSLLSSLSKQYAALHSSSSFQDGALVRVVDVESAGAGGSSSSLRGCFRGSKGPRRAGKREPVLDCVFSSLICSLFLARACSRAFSSAPILMLKERHQSSFIATRRFWIKRGEKRKPRARSKRASKGRDHPCRFKNFETHEQKKNHLSSSSRPRSSQRRSPSPPLPSPYSTRRPRTRTRPSSPAPPSWRSARPCCRRRGRTPWLAPRGRLLLQSPLLPLPLLLLLLQTPLPRLPLLLPRSPPPRHPLQLLLLAPQTRQRPLPTRHARPRRRRCSKG